MCSMAHPRRSRGERILALEASKTADLSLGYASSGLALRRPKGKHLVVERSRVLVRWRKTGFPAKSPLWGITRYLGNGERTQSTTKTGVILVMPSTNDIRGVSSESQYPSDKRGPDLTSFTGQ